MIAHPNDDDQRMAITTWNNCAYTIQVMGKPNTKNINFFSFKIL
jgi:hypothetical protein